MLWLWIGCGIMMILLVAAYCLGRYFFQRAFDAKSDKSDIIQNASHRKKKPEDLWFEQEVSHIDVQIKSHDDLTLQGTIIRNHKTKWVVLVHGYMGCKKDLIPAAKRFYGMGCSVLLIDLRGHGKSEGTVIGFGALDHLDIHAWCKYLTQQYHATDIALYGVSMGAASVMMCADETNGCVKVIIEDCGFTSLREQLTHQLRKMLPHVPPCIPLFCLSLCLRAKAGYTLKQACPMDHVAQAKVPMLFLNGERDNFIPITMMEQLAKSCPTLHHVVRLPKGRHANSSLLEPHLYWEEVVSFLNKIQFLP